MNNKTTLITGLGNIGSKYDGTRHNVGFMAIDFLQQKFKLNSFEESTKFKAYISTTKLDNGLNIILAKPTTFMNLSGVSVGSILNYFKIDTKELILIHDDLDIAFGTFKIHEKNPKKHNGVNSIKEIIGKESIFTSIRIGIENRGVEDKQIPSINYVLSKFATKEVETLEETVFPEIAKSIGNLILK
jgi:peptidyl-tRNA hydrolase, PTH1 family